MLGVLWATIPMKVLSIVGAVLLAILALSLAGFLVFLFFPFTYRVSGSKDASGIRLAVKVNWLFGLFRVRFGYPEPGRLTVKALWFALFDSRIPPDPQEGEGGRKRRGKKKKSGKKKSGKMDSGGKRSDGKRSDRKASDGKRPGSGPAALPERAAPPERADLPSGADPADGPADRPEERAGEGAASGSFDREPQESTEKFSKKIQTIKYTICSSDDKIKKIWKNISYYIELLQEENTKQLAAHAMQRAVKVMKSAGPKHVRIELVFGTGSPDTTGYLYGGYCVLASALGAGFWVTPDFERRIFEGEFEAAGRVTVWVLAVNGLKLLFDRKLRVFLRGLRAAQRKASA